MVATSMSLSCFFTKKSYRLVNDNGIFVEAYDSTNIDKNKYTADNIVYSDGDILEFEYLFISKDGDTLFFKQTENKSIPRNKRWKFVNKDSIDDKSITGYSLTVENGIGGMFMADPDYDQSVIEYKFIYNSKKTSRNSEYTGLIENHKNIWMHPSRSSLFRITQLNPWPFIQKPYKVGNKFSWSLKTGDSWGDERWLTWTGTIETKYDYEIVKKESITINNVSYNCLVISAIGTSVLGRTKLKSYFHETYGFIHLHYTNIDSSQLIIKSKFVSSN